MAISKKRKEELVAQYIEWMNRSQAFYLTEYIGLSMADIDVMRHRVRETGGEFHVIKNTLGKSPLIRPTCQAVKNSWKTAQRFSLLFKIHQRWPKFFRTSPAIPNL